MKHWQSAWTRHFHAFNQLLLYRSADSLPLNSELPMKPEKRNIPSQKESAFLRWSSFAQIATLCGFLFGLTFYPANWLAAHTVSRWSTGTEWDRNMPYEPAWFLAYGSVFLFVALIPLRVGHSQIIRAWGRKLAMAILCATPFFLVFPTQATFPPIEPHTSSPTLDLIRAITGQYNSFPSLHAALSWLTARTLADSDMPCCKILWWSWFTLIALSTLLTHQHNIADVAAGILLGWLVERIYGQDTSPQHPQEGL